MGKGPRSAAPESHDVSVVLAVRNGEDFLCAALESLFLSRLPPLEVIVVDGASSDRTLEIARAFPRTQVIERPADGVSNARNDGVARAAGRYIAFQCHDDLWPEGYLDSQVAALEAQLDADIVAASVLHFLEPGHTPPPGFRTSLLEAPAPGHVPEACVFRREVFDRVGPFDPGFRVSEDTEWFARAIDRGVTIANNPAVTVGKRVHGENLSLNAGVKMNAALLKLLRDSVRRKQAAADQA